MSFVKKGIILFILAIYEVFAIFRKDICGSFSWRFYFSSFYRILFLMHARISIDFQGPHMIILSYSFILFVFYLFFRFFFYLHALFNISRLLPDLGNGSIRCIWYNHGYERHLLSTSQPYRVNVNDSQLLCALRRCYYWYNRGISSCNEKEKIPGFARLPFCSFLSSIV